MSTAPPRNRRNVPPELAARREARRLAVRRRRRNALLAAGAVVVLAAGAAWYVTRDGGSSSATAGGGGSGGGGGGEPAVDTGPPPRVGVRAPEPRLPLPARPVLRVAARGGDGLQMRMQARSTDGLQSATGPWVAAAAALPAPPQVMRIGGRGTLKAWVEVKDGAGRTARSGAVAVTVPPAAGGSAQVVGSVATRKRVVALVFDDGLEPGAIASIVATLRRAGAGATFCFNGVNMSRWDAAVRRTVRAAVLDGTIEMCSHGYSHRTGSGTTYQEAMQDLQANAAMERDLGVSTVPFYRPPYGLLSPGMQEAVSALGYRWILMWSIDPSDYTKPAVSDLTQRVVSRATPGGIAVMHAIGNTADALPGIIAGLKAKGLRPVTASRLLAAGRPQGWGGSGGGTTG